MHNVPSSQIGRAASDLEKPAAAIFPKRSPLWINKSCSNSDNVGQLNKNQKAGCGCGSHLVKTMEEIVTDCLYGGVQ